MDTVTVAPRIVGTQEKQKNFELAKEITTPDGFINTDRFSVSEFIGKKVILIDFWTYSCINCQRTTPYLNAWHEKYKDNGLVIVGIHTPEFEFEKDINNVKKAVEKFGIKYPVVLDNDYSTWNAYKNRYWPRKYLIDIDGFIVYDHIGEGSYEETEKKIQELLEERVLVLDTEKDIDKSISRPQDAESVEFSKILSPEMYFGSIRNKNIGRGPALLSNVLYLDGAWNVEGEFAENKNAGAKISIKYTAKNVYLVASAGTHVNIKILKDGKETKTISIKESGLYRLIEDSDYGSHALEIIIESPGLKAFAFTFG
jgi:thiol-disulfide isomerase/thioredoxin